MHPTAQAEMQAIVEELANVHVSNTMRNPDPPLESDYESFEHKVIALIDRARQVRNAIKGGGSIG